MNVTKYASVESFFSAFSFFTGTIALVVGEGVAVAALGVTLANASEASADAGAGANVSCGGVLLAFGDALAVALAFALHLAAATGADFMTDFIVLLGAIAKTALTQQIGVRNA